MKTRNAPPPWQPRVKQPGEATGNTFDIRSDVYVPEKHNPAQPMRPGADDHLKFQSVGDRT